MTEERNFGVTEARLGLTLLTCLLVGLGFAILQRLGDPAGSSRIELRVREPGTGIAGAASSESPGDDTQPQVLPTQSGDAPGESLPPRLGKSNFSRPAPWSGDHGSPGATGADVSWPDNELEPTGHLRTGRLPGGSTPE